MEKAFACWHISPAETQILPVGLPASGPDEVLIRASHSLISTGTERLVALGRVPAEVQADMQVPFMGGSFTFPVKYGYSLVGEVLSPDHPLSGQWVHLLHPHQTLLRVPASALSPIPSGIPLRRAVLASNLETALNAVWDSQVSLGDRVAIVGMGLVGLLTGLLVQKIPGIHLTVWDTSPVRQHQARQLRFQVGADPAPASCDVVFHTSATAPGLQTALDLTGPEATLVELSWYGDRPVSLSLGGHFHAGRKRILSSQVSHLPATRLPRWDFRRRKAVVWDLLQDPVFDQLLTEPVPFDALPAWFDRLRQGHQPAPGVYVVYAPEAI
ncbi:MAG: zinc-binding alcohol dehydrogenase [Bacteroidia bacterium]|nr:zinc-binding alcohol dehydrogenase [Bacteroidia bacterium]